MKPLLLVSNYEFINPIMVEAQGRSPVVMPPLSSSKGRVAVFLCAI